MDFYVIDVETANYDFASICQIGIAGYKNGQLEYEWESLVNPGEDFPFSKRNVNIHGITPSMVVNAPTFPELYNTINGMLSHNLVVCHTFFDRTAINGCCSYHGLTQLSCRWVNSASIVRKTWELFANKGYGLSNVCAYLKYEFNHHMVLFMEL